MIMNKHVLVGISGGIASYKTLTLIRLFVKNGYEVKVIATPNALEFVTPLTLETLSSNKLYVDMFEINVQRTTEHISLSQWADVVVIAPATANCIAKMAMGIADDALSTTVLACKKPIFIAPSMNENMLTNFAVQKNIKTLINNGFHVLESETGFLACQTKGNGRMLEPEKIYEHISRFLHLPKIKLKALITAGGTQEPIDAVRYIGNRSSGLMGFALAEAFANRGIAVDLVSAPSVLQTKSPIINRIDVVSAADMYEACSQCAKSADIIVMAAAVADYTPEKVYDSKLKKQDKQLNLQLSPTIDILKTLSTKRQKKGQFVVGFALETDNEIDNAKQKIKNKNLDMIVLNSLNDKGAGFSTITNKVLLIDKKENIIDIPLKDKYLLAEDIVEYILNKIKIQNDE